MPFTQYIADIVIILLLGLSIFIGYKKGFLGLVVYLLAGVLTLVLSSLLCKPLGVALGNMGLEGALGNAITGIMEPNNAIFTTPIKGITEDQISQALAALNLPAFITTAIANMIHEAAAAASIPEGMTILSVIVDGLVNLALTAIAWLILFVLLTIIFALLKKFIKVFDKIPLIGSLNKWLGALVCLILAAAVLLILMYLFIMLAPAMPVSVVTYVSKSPFLGMLYQYNPLAMLLTKIFA